MSQSIHFTTLWVDPATKVNTQILERGGRLVWTPLQLSKPFQLTADLPMQGKSVFISKLCSTVISLVLLIKENYSIK